MNSSTPGIRTAGLAAVLLLSACTASQDRLTAPIATRTSSIARWATNDAGFINVCKASGPAGTYAFAVNVDGGGHFYTGQGPNDHTTPSVDFDGTNLVCTRAYTVVLDDSWTTETTADVTLTELLPDGVTAAEIKVFNPRVLPSYLYSLFDTPTITLTVGPTDRRKVQYYNVRKPPPPPVLANCVELTLVEGVPLTPTQLTASGGNGGPYTFGATGLPAGLSLSSDGILSGTPTVTGTFSYTVTVEDSDGNSGTSESCSVTVRPPGKTFGIGPSSMEGHLKIPINSWFNGGYSFKFKSGTHVATQFTVDAKVEITVTCPYGGGPGGTILIPLGVRTYNVPANNTAWLPTGDANSILSWMGAVHTPDLCGGFPMDNAKGAVFTATVSQFPVTGSLVDFRFKYRDPAAKGKVDTNCTDPNEPKRNDAATCGASWSQTVTDP